MAITIEEKITNSFMECYNQAVENTKLIVGPDASYKKGDVFAKLALALATTGLVQNKPTNPVKEQTVIADSPKEERHAENSSEKTESEAPEQKEAAVKEENETAKKKEVKQKESAEKPVRTRESLKPHTFDQIQKDIADAEGDTNTVANNAEVEAVSENNPEKSESNVNNAASAPKAEETAETHNSSVKAEEPAKAEAKPVEFTAEWTDESVKALSNELDFVAAKAKAYGDKTINDCVSAYSQDAIKTIDGLNPLNIKGFVAYLKDLEAQIAS